MNQTGQIEGVKSAARVLDIFELLAQPRGRPQPFGYCR
jgi:hypothetical protein